MKVNAQYSQEVFIDPKEVIKNLQREALHPDAWFIKDGGKFYEVKEIYGGAGHSHEFKTEISKARFDYLEALDTVSRYLEFA